MNQASGRLKVAFQGERGAFSEEAAIKLLGSEIELVPRATFAELFRSIDEGVADHVLAPVENSIVGTIQPCPDLLYKSNLVILSEITIPIAQHLIGCPGASLGEIETVESHPVALAQCGRFFASHPWLRKIEAQDTAGSVAQVIASRDSKRAAIAGLRAAEIHGASILKEHVEDDRDNQTRFLLLSSSQNAGIDEQSRDLNYDRDQKRREALRSFFLANRDRTRNQLK